MECTKEMYEDIANKCKEQYANGDVQEWDEDVKCALRQMAHNRCPLSIVNYTLNDFILEMVEEYCDENGIDFDDLDFEIEEILYVE